MYLGSGMLFGFVCEVVLKLLELIDGLIVVMVELLFGFWYGLKMFFDECMFVVVLLFGDLYMCCYDFDLLCELWCENCVVGILLVGVVLVDDVGDIGMLLLFGDDLMVLLLFGLFDFVFVFVVLVFV